MVEELQYIVSYDSNKIPFDGSKQYKLSLPPNVPASNFWSVIVYDSHSRLIISTDQPWLSVHSQSKKLLANQDGSVTIWFGPETHNGQGNNWIKTIPGKNWNMILRLYYPTESWFEKTWRPGEIEEVK